MITIRREHAGDVAAREALLDRVFGAARFEKASERLREGRLPAPGLAFVATEGKRLVGTVRLWNVNAGPAHPALLLGPLAVDACERGRGLGSALMEHALAEAERRGHGAVLLVGDAPYYGRFGFSAAATQALAMPGACDRDRLLARELRPRALAGASGLIAPTGRGAPLRRARPVATDAYARAA